MHEFTRRRPGWGEPAPWFAAPTASNPKFQFSSVGGRVVVLLFYQSARDEGARRALQLLQTHRAIFDDRRACFFGVIGDPSDVEQGLAEDSVPGLRYFHDFGGEIAALFGAAEQDGGRVTHPGWLVLDQRLRVVARAPIEEAEAIIDFVTKFAQASLSAATTLERHPPIVMIPRIFEPAFCKALIELYERNGGQESGFMRDVDGKTRLILDHSHKRRSDMTIEDEQLRLACAARIRSRLAPELARAFQFAATRIERYIVACYDASGGGYFRPHRDNTTKGTAHRRFAVTINLNATEYEGGDLRFPEYGPTTYRAPTGGAIVFSCSLLHEATPVTSGRRYAFLPFLYDEAARHVRDANLKHVALEMPDAENNDGAEIRP